MAEVPSISVKNAAGDIVDVATLTAIIALVGERQATPTTNTLLDRLKQIRAAMDANNDLMTSQAQMLDGLEGLIAATNAAIDALSAKHVAALGARTVAQSPTINIATDQPAIAVDAKSNAHDVSAVITRPGNINPYAAGDVLGGACTFVGASKPGASLLITSAQLELDFSSVPAGMTTFRLYLYSVVPPSALGDNAAFDLEAGDRASFLGFVDLGSPVKIGSTLYCEVTNVQKQIKTASADVFGYLVTAAGFTPASNSEVYKVTLHTAEI